MSTGFEAKARLAQNVRSTEPSHWGTLPEYDQHPNTSNTASQQQKEETGKRKTRGQAADSCSRGGARRSSFEQYDHLDNIRSEKG